MIIQENNPTRQVKTAQERFQDVCAAASGLTLNGTKGNCLCPAHDDRKPSLSIELKESGYIVVHCHSNHCRFEDIAFAWGLPLSTFFPEGGGRPGGPRQPKSQHGVIKPKEKRRTVDAGTLDRLGDKLGSTLNYAEENPQSLAWWAQRLGVSLDSLRSFGCGTAVEAHCIGYTEWSLLVPEFGADGYLCSINTRYCTPINGKNKLAAAGTPRGLAKPCEGPLPEGPVFCFEGASDCFAAHTAGFHAIGRPNCMSGGDMIAIYAAAARRHVVIWGENDAKPDGRWPGRDGAVKVSNEVSERLAETPLDVSRCLPPQGVKDFRDWLRQRVPNLDNAAALAAFRAEVLAHVKANGEAIPKPEDPNAFDFPSAEAEEERRKAERCERPRRRMLHHLNCKNVFKGMLLGCRHCLPCIRRQRRLKREEVHAFLSEWQEWYTRDVPIAEWDAIRRRLHRRGAEHTRVPLTGGMIRVVTNSPIVLDSGFVRVTLEEAKAANATAIDDHIGSSRPGNVSTSNRENLIYSDANGELCNKADAAFVSRDGGTTWEAIPQPEWEKCGSFRKDWQLYLARTQREHPTARVLIEMREEPSAVHAWICTLPHDWSPVQIEAWKESMKSQFSHREQSVCGNWDSSTIDVTEFDDDFCPVFPLRGREAG